MDWTESFACAVFFAQLHRKREERAAVWWVLDPQALNKATVGAEGLMALGDDVGEVQGIDPRASGRLLPTVAAAPLFTNPRMVAQRSMFTLAGDSFQPLEIQYPDLLQESRLSKIVLPTELFDDAEEYLSMAGLTAFSFYPVQRVNSVGLSPSSFYFAISVSLIGRLLAVEKFFAQR